MNSFRFVSIQTVDVFAIANFHISHSCLFKMEQSPEILDKYKVFVDDLLHDPALRTFSAFLSKVEDFYEPLDYKGLGLRQYIQIVKYPMDLGTIKVLFFQNRLLYSV